MGNMISGHLMALVWTVYLHVSIATSKLMHLDNKTESSILKQEYRISICFNNAFCHLVGIFICQWVFSKGTHITAHVFVQVEGVIIVSTAHGVANSLHHVRDHC